MTLTQAERNAIRSRIAAALCNLGEFHLYWMPDRRRVLCRSVQTTRHFRVPAGAAELGIYAAGGPSAVEIVGDLEALLERLESAG